MSTQFSRIGVLTSGGDAQGMNAAVRAVVRTALSRGIEVYAIYEGYQGMVEGSEYIRKMTWESVSSIIQYGGTVIGSARSADFRSREGRLRAARNLIEHDIDRLVIIGGDGSLTGANMFRQEWSSLLEELVHTQQINAEMAARHPYLSVVGLVGSIDNDMVGTDMTIGADTALHRITEAIDAITSTAASHQRTFVVEVMGRNCGYLALMGAVSGGADYVLIPESPPDVEDWESEMCELLKTGRDAGRRDSVVVVAEGARDRAGNPISADYVRKVLQERLGEDTRVTILGHVQRGGSPSAFDRTMSTLLGNAAVEELLNSTSDSEPRLIGIRENRITRAPLMQCVEQTHAIADMIANKEYARALHARGGSFAEIFETFKTLCQVKPRDPAPQQRSLRLAVIHAGGPAPGMNTAVRVAVRLGIDRGHRMFGVQGGFQGLIEGQINEMNWNSVSGWAITGGAEFGTNRKIPDGSDFYAIARVLEDYEIQGILMIGGWSGYQAALKMHNERRTFPAFNIPIVCLPATINNNLPGSELSIGADTSLNNIVRAVDKIKQSAVASRRTVVVEVMGRSCGYLALMSGLATGAERVYLPEYGVKLADLQQDLAGMIRGFRHGRRLSLLIRNEQANPVYTTNFMCSLFEEEGSDLFEVRQAILGHLQQGGDPSPFDRIQATRLATRCLEYLIAQADLPHPSSACIGLQSGRVQFLNLEDVPRLMDEQRSRPLQQWWLGLNEIVKTLSNH